MTFAVWLLADCEDVFTKARFVPQDPDEGQRNQRIEGDIRQAEAAQRDEPCVKVEKPLSKPEIGEAPTKS